MSYFRELPDIFYQSPLKDRKSSREYLRVKNLFRRVKLRDDLQNVFTVFDKYAIPEGGRPETVAEELYGSVEYDWIVLLTAGITHIRDQWPLSNTDLYRYSEEKYGKENLLNVHHWETTEVKDSEGRIILPAKKVVDENFTIPNPLNKSEDLNPTVSISNYEYETIKNNDKRNIYILKVDYLQQYLNDMRKIMNYEKSSQYVTRRLAQTENTRNTNI